jgi:hypothetical protein
VQVEPTSGERTCTEISGIAIKPCDCDCDGDGVALGKGATEIEPLRQVSAPARGLVEHGAMLNVTRPNRVGPSVIPNGDPPCWYHLRGAPRAT